MEARDIKSPIEQFYKDVKLTTEISPDVLIGKGHADTFNKLLDLAKEVDDQNQILLSISSLEKGTAKMNELLALVGQLKAAISLRGPRG